MSAFKTIATVTLWLIFVLVSFASMEWGSFGGGDFDTVYYAVRDYLPHQLPYPSVVGYLTGAWVYPPLLAQLLAPLVYAFDLPWATRLWFILNAAALLYLLVRLYRYVPQQDRFTYWVFAATFVPVFEALHIGQVTVLLLVIIGLVWILVKDGRFWLAGAMLALATWIKIYPIVLIVYFVWKGNWTIVKSALLVGIALGLFQIMISGTGIFEDFFSMLLLIASQSDHTMMWKNLSIYGFASRLFETNPGIAPILVSSTLFMFVRYGLTLVVVGVFFVLTTRSKANPYITERQFDLEYALTVMTMLLLSPWLYTESIAPALITFFLLWRNTHDWRKRLILVMAHVILLINYMMLPADFGAAAIFVYSFGFCGLVVLWSLNVSMLHQLRRFRSEPTPIASVSLG